MGNVLIMLNHLLFVVLLAYINPAIEVFKQIYVMSNMVRTKSQNIGDNDQHIPGMGRKFPTSLFYRDSE